MASDLFDTPKTLDVLAVGDANMDVWMQVPHHPDLAGSGERGMGVRGDAYYFGAGGVAANVAMGVSRLGNKAGFVGAIGKDDLGDQFQSSLRSAGIDVGHLYIMEHGSTSLACIFEPTQGEFVFYVCPGSRYIPPEHLPDDYLASARMLFLPGHMLTQDEITCRTLLDALHKARQYHTQIVLDPAKYWLNPDLESFVFDAIAISDLILPNRSEAELLTGCGAPVDAAAALMDMGASNVAITLGAEGCLVASNEGIFACEGIKTEIKSALGAGDAFTSGFLHGCLKGWPMMETARFANATAALKIRTAGSQEGLPDASTVEAYLKE
jgi:2-dehydro-3-deoxygluconokinase